VISANLLVWIGVVGAFDAPWVVAFLSPLVYITSGFFLVYGSYSLSVVTSNGKDAVLWILWSRRNDLLGWYSAGEFGGHHPQSNSGFKEADVVACESKERALKLLSHLQIKKPLIYLREASRMSDVKRIIELHQQGKTVAVTTDAGMPGISDPGAYLVRELSAQGIAFTVVPGPSALCMSITISGLEEPWVFLAFYLLRKANAAENWKSSCRLTLALSSMKVHIA